MKEINRNGNDGLVQRPELIQPSAAFDKLISNLEESNRRSASLPDRPMPSKRSRGMLALHCSRFE
jgi:hypothetical protein